MPKIIDLLIDLTYTSTSMTTFKKTFLTILLLFPFIISAQTPGVKHVVLIGIDGLGANYLKEVNNIPNIQQMQEEGSFTMHARCIRPSSSAANWASMTMGAGPSLTGYTEWDSKTPEIPSRVQGEYGIFPTIYELLRTERPKSKIGVIYTWSGIGHLFPKEVIDYDKNTNEDDLTEQEGIQYLKSEKPDLLFLHFDNVDGAGHGIGWGTKEYKEAVRKMDERIGNILQAAKEVGIYEETIFLVTADHGGFEKGHGGDHIGEIEIPWIIIGPGIKKNHELKSSIMTFDTAATIAQLLGLEKPQVWTGRTVEEAFRK